DLPAAGSAGTGRAASAQPPLCSRCTLCWVCEALCLSICAFLPFYYAPGKGSSFLFDDLPPASSSDAGERLCWLCWPDLPSLFITNLLAAGLCVVLKY
uniref:Uncharacterized protein n=1 Tax=Coturnix japonica TaxID=93934 RepID=A0A8C2Y5M3_COTJA